MGIFAGFFRRILASGSLVASLLALAPNGVAAPNDLTSWSLRFSSAQSINVATTGCYGTASYGYVLPSVEYVQAYRGSLRQVASQNGLGGFAFTGDKDANGNHVVVDLDSGSLSAVPQVFNASYKGAVFCQCRPDLTHFTSIDGAPNCTKSNLLPLGYTFLATRDGVSSDPLAPQPSDDWVDPVTGWQWHFAAAAANWQTAIGACGGGFTLPDHQALAHVARRLWNSELGLRLHAAGSRRVWSNEEFEGWAAMAVYIPEGDAGSVNKRTLYPVLCVKQ